MQAPLDSLDLSLVSILYTQGNMAAITPSFNYNFKVLNTTVQIDSWRQLLYWLGPPGQSLSPCQDQQLQCSANSFHVTSLPSSVYRIALQQPLSCTQNTTASHCVSWPWWPSSLTLHVLCGFTATCCAKHRDCRANLTPKHSLTSTLPAGLVMATVILFTVAEPRKKGQGLLFSFLRKPEADETPQEPVRGKRSPSGSRTASASSTRLAAQQGDADEASTSGQDSMWGSVQELLSSRAFQVQPPLVDGCSITLGGPVTCGDGDPCLGTIQCCSVPARNIARSHGAVLAALIPANAEQAGCKGCPTHQPCHASSSLHPRSHVCSPLLQRVVTVHVVQALTLAAAINDVGSWALVGWQATFYQRVFDVGPDQYAPALACLLPIGGIVGGVGGGLLADKLSRLGATSWLTSGAARLYSRRHASVTSSILL